MMKTVTIDERRIAARIALVDEHCQAEMDCDLDRTLATLIEAPDNKMNRDEFSGRESVGLPCELGYGLSRPPH